MISAGGVAFGLCSFFSLPVWQFLRDEFIKLFRWNGKCQKAYENTDASFLVGKAFERTSYELRLAIKTVGK